MWVAAAAFNGLIAAGLMWLLSLRLVPDTRGRSLEGLSVQVRHVLFTATLVVGAGGAAVVAALLPERPSTVAFALFAAVASGLAVADAVTHRLPFAVSGGLVVVAAVSFGWEALASDGSGSVVRAGWAALVVGGLALAWWRCFDGGVGLGDVALLAVIGGFAGWWSWAAVWVALAAGFGLAALGAGVARWGLGKAGAYLPLGPFLLAGWWAAFALAVTG